MRFKIHFSILLLLAITFITSCQRDNETVGEVPFLGGDRYASTEIDKWVYENLTVPYNMQVKWRFDETEVAQNSTLVPVLESKVLPSLNNIKTVWIDPYMKIAGTNFFKSHVPKLITLVGSPSFNSNGSITLGVAESGLKILLYDMNRYDPITNRSIFIEKMHTIHHEFAHILHQTKIYSPIFQTISVGGYTGNWTLSTMAEANGLGFVTPYARSSADEDFVETIATMLVEGKDYFENLKQSLRNGGNATAADKLSQKEQIVVSYYKEQWGIDFTALQEDVRLAIESISTVPILTSTWIGNTQYYRSIKTDSTILRSQTGGNFKDSIDKIFATIAPPYAYRLDSVTFGYAFADTIVMRVKMAQRSATTSVFISDYKFKITTTSNGTTTFGPAVYSGTNANFFITALAPLTNYLTRYPGILSWRPGYPLKPIYSNLTSQWAGFAGTGTNNSSFLWGITSQSVN